MGRPKDPNSRQDMGVPPSGSGCQPTASAANASSLSGIPNAEDLWSDEICALVDWGFSTVSRYPSDHEANVAYRRVIASVLSHMREGWSWEHGSFMGAKGWMWKRDVRRGER